MTEESESGGYDAAAIVGKAAGLGAEGGEAPERVTPEALVRRFCGQEAQGLVAAPGVTEQAGVVTARGHCGYVGGRGELLVTGFDDGYTFMGYLEERGWRALAAKGDWPYVIYLSYPARAEGEPWTLAEYCEGDLTVWRFADRSQALAHYRSLRDCP